MDGKFREQDAVARLAEHYRAILEILGEDPSRDGLSKTPERAARAIWYATRGYRQNVSDVIHEALFDVRDSQLVVVKNIEYYSLCEHHILPFFGHASIGYLPGEKIIGLSKVARIVDMFARRLQVQERLTAELAQVLAEALGARGVIVRVTGRHLCMAMRGVQKQDSETVTTVATGELLTNAALRKEFFSAI